MPNLPAPVRTHGTATAIALLIAALLAGCSAEHPTILGCDAGSALTPDCRFQNPEDLVPAPNGRQLLVSQLGAIDGSIAGSLAAYDPAEGSIEVLFPAERSNDDRIAPARPAADAPDDAAWGSADCPPPDPSTFSPHGIDIETTSGGRHALYVVNHGGRESVEMFEVSGGQPVELTWRGCVLAPEQGNFNDLVVLRDGGFWVSQMYPRDANVLWTVLRMQLTGHTPGHVYHWQPQQGFRRIPGTEIAFGNGVEKSEDERILFVNGYFSNEVRKVDVGSGEMLGSAEVSSPDNLTWSPTGELLAASHLAPLPDVLACQELEQGSCGFHFQIVAIEPESMRTRVVLDHAGPPMGAATVALPFGDAVYLGTFAGDRIARAPASILRVPGG